MKIEIGQKVDVKIGICHYDAIVIDIDRLGNKIKLGWEEEDEAYGDESWWEMTAIDIKARG